MLTIACSVFPSVLHFPAQILWLGRNFGVRSVGLADGWRSILHHNRSLELDGMPHFIKHYFLTLFF